jgi:hypothetical protein
VTQTRNSSSRDRATPRRGSATSWASRVAAKASSTWRRQAAASSRPFCSKQSTPATIFRPTRRSSTDSICSVVASTPPLPRAGSPRRCPPQGRRTEAAPPGSPPRRDRPRSPAARPSVARGRPNRSGIERCRAKMAAGLERRSDHGPCAVEMKR